MKTTYKDSDRHKQLSIYDQLAVIGHQLCEIGNGYAANSPESQKMEVANLDIDTAKVRLRDAILN